jgi:hypothetical protein
MEGRYPNGLLVVISNCGDPSKEEEFNYWYNHIHLPDVTSAGVFRHAMRFVNTAPNPEGGKYFATYETNWEDVTEATKVMGGVGARLREEGRYTPHLQVVLGGAFKKLGGEFSAASRPARGILMLLLNCNDPAREEEYNRWYSDVHIPDILNTGLFHTAYRYESLDPQNTKGKYLTIYETDSSDPSRAGDELLKLRATWDPERLFDGTERMLLATARRIWPMD